MQHLTDSPAPDALETGYLGLIAASEAYWLPVTAVREIRSWTVPTILPGHDLTLLGVINLRGTILPVLDLARLLGQPQADLGRRPVIVVIEAAGRLAGLAVEGVLDMIHLPAERVGIPPAASGSARARLAAVAVLDDKPLRILDPTTLVVPSAAVRV